jgi:hypothetical protein
VGETVVAMPVPVAGTRPDIVRQTCNDAVRHCIDDFPAFDAARSTS